MAEDRDKDDPEQEHDFTVSDRRHWARERREEPSEAEGEAAPPPPPPEVEPPPRAEEVSGEAAPPPHEAEAPPGELPPADLSYLVVFLATQAMLCLGEYPDPETGEKVEENLPGAKHAIDLLGVIQEKTQGNISDEEQRLLEGVLYDLRIRYVQAAGPAA
jgi:hypothetical protein